MTSTDRIRIRFVRPYGVYRKGDVLEMDRGPAKSWLITGFAELVGERQPELELAVERREVETADATPRRKRR